MSLNMKSVNKFTQQKYGSIDVTFTSASSHQMHHAQFGRSTQSALHIFNSSEFTHEAIREQEIK